MADEKDEKIKRTVPGMVRSAKGVAEHAEAVLNMQLDREKRVFKDPFTVTMALLTYARLTATLLAEAEERWEIERTRMEKRLAEFETRLTTMERWKNEAEAMTQEMVKQAESMMAGGPAAFKENLTTMFDKAVPAATKPKAALPSLPIVENNGEKKQGDIQ